MLVEGLASESRGKIPQLQQKGRGFGEEIKQILLIALGQAPLLVQLFQ